MSCLYTCSWKSAVPVWTVNKVKKSSLSHFIQKVVTTREIATSCLFLCVMLMSYSMTFIALNFEQDVLSLVHQKTLLHFILPNQSTDYQTHYLADSSLTSNLLTGQQNAQVYSRVVLLCPEAVRF